MNKLNVNGKVAALVSYGYGAGWYTWNTDNKEMVFDPDIAKILIDCDNEPSQKDRDEILSIAKKKYPDAYLGGVDGLRVELVDTGSVFEITEYDGSESLEVLVGKEYLTA